MTVTCVTQQVQSVTKKKKRKKTTINLSIGLTVLSYHVGLVQKQTREVEEAETLFIRGVRKLSEMEQIRQNVRGENGGE